MTIPKANMGKIFTTLCTIVALSVPASAEAIMGAGYCTEILPVKVDVQKGDTLIDLARAHYNGDVSRYKDIAKYNGIKNPNKLRIGQALELPSQRYERVRLVSVADFVVGRYCRSYPSHYYQETIDELRENMSFQPIL